MCNVKCEVVRDLMPLVADDVASVESRQLVQAHLENCETCRAYYEGMTARLEKTPVPEEDTSFIRFCRRMESGFRLRRVLVWLLIAALAVLACGAGGIILSDRMNAGVAMPVERTKASLIHDVNGQVFACIEMQDGYGWYGWTMWKYDRECLWITPEMPSLVLWNRGNTNPEQMEALQHVVWEDGRLYYVEQECDVVYDEENDLYTDQWTTVKKPIGVLRWGTPDDFTTLYEQGDRIPDAPDTFEKAEK